MFRRVFQSLPRLPDRQTFTCAVAILSFVGGTVGFPLEPLGIPKAGCCCGDAVQASRSCCCQISQQNSTAKGSCCANRSSKPMSCCEEREGHERRQKDSSKQAPIAMSACSCGGAADYGLLINTQPRSLPHVVSVLADGSRESLVPPVLPILIGISLDPETPPPKMQFAFAS